MRDANKEYILGKLNLYDIFLEKGQINMRNQDELNRINIFIKEYMTKDI